VCPVVPTAPATPSPSPAPTAVDPTPGARGGPVAEPLSFCPSPFSSVRAPLQRRLPRGEPPGMWSERDALDALALPSRERVLDVGCGTGELAAVFAEESDAEVLALDADKTLLSHVDADGRLLGDATQLPSARTAATWSPARRCSSTSPTPSPPSGSSRGSPRTSSPPSNPTTPRSPSTRRSPRSRR